MLLGYFHVIVGSFYHEQEGRTESEKVSTIERERETESSMFVLVLLTKCFMNMEKITALTAVTNSNFVSFVHSK